MGQGVKLGVVLSDDFVCRFSYLTRKESHPFGADYGGDDVCPLPCEAETGFSFLETPYMAIYRIRFSDSLLAEGRNPQRRLSEGDSLSSDLIRASSSGLSSPAQPGSESPSS